MIDPEVNRYIVGLHPFIDYCFEPKDDYMQASAAGYLDTDNDFLLDSNGGFLMKIDFVFVNTKVFSEVGDYFDKYKKYTDAKPGTVSYKEFYKRETRRRRIGMTANCKLYRCDIEAYNNAKNSEKEKYLHPLRITGDHYNYLNYGRIIRTPTKEEKLELIKQGKIKQKLISGFPRYWDGDYWNFKCDEFIINNKYHLCKGKARRKGYSFKRGSQSANTINLNKEITIVLAAWDITYLTDPGATTAMLKTNLDWYENNTYWQRGYLSEDLSSIELGYKLSNAANKKFGFRSRALSVTCRNNPNAAVGKGAIEIDFEESGVFPNLQETLNVTLSATEVGNEQVGTIRVYGTGGTKGANWIDFCNCFYHPEANDMMPFANVWDVNSKNTHCGFFHPQMWNCEPHMDEHGNSFLVKAFLLDKEDKEDKKKKLKADDYSIYCSQRANSPSDAFNIQTENMFSSIDLSEHVKWVRANQNNIICRDGVFFKDSDGRTIFRTNDELKNKGEKVHDFIMNQPFKRSDDIHGCWRIYNEPKRYNGIIPDNLYYVLIDPVGKDKSIKEISVKNSLNAIYVMSYPNDIGVPGDQIQAVFVGRVDDALESCSREALSGCEYYNAKALPETDRGTVVADFRRWNKLNRLIKNPLGNISSKVKESNINDYGVCIGTGDNAVNAMIQFKQWLYEIVNVNEDGSFVYRLHHILDLPTLLELEQFKADSNFDRLSALRLISFERLSYITKKKKPSSANTRQTFLSSIGLYKN